MPYVPRKTPGQNRWHAITNFGDRDPVVFNVFCVWNYTTTVGGDAFSAFVEAKDRASVDAATDALVASLPPDGIVRVE